MVDKRVDIEYDTDPAADARIAELTAGDRILTAALLLLAFAFFLYIAGAFITVNAYWVTDSAPIYRIGAVGWFSVVGVALARWAFK